MTSFLARAKRLVKTHVETRYYDGRTHPMCWNVKMNCPRGVSLEFDDVFKRMTTHCDFGFVNTADALVSISNMETLKEEWGTGEKYEERIMEDMCRTFVGKDMDDTMRCCSPKVYKRFGLPEDYDKMWDVEYDFYGRSGGWLVLKQFEGVTITEDWSNDNYFGDGEFWYQKLCCQIVSTTWMVGQRYNEFMYQAAFHMKHLLEDMT